MNSTIYYYNVTMVLIKFIILWIVIFIGNLSSAPILPMLDAKIKKNNKSNFAGQLSKIKPEKPGKKLLYLLGADYDNTLAPSIIPSYRS